MANFKRTGGMGIAALIAALGIGCSSPDYSRIQKQTADSAKTEMQRSAKGTLDSIISGEKLKECQAFSQFMYHSQPYIGPYGSPGFQTSVDAGSSMLVKIGENDAIMPARTESGRLSAIGVYAKAGEDYCLIRILPMGTIKDGRTSHDVGDATLTIAKNAPSNFPNMLQSGYSLAR